MANVLVKDLYTTNEGQKQHQIQISGWIRTIRSSKKIAFF